MHVPSIPSVAWTWPIGAKWKMPYVVRYASNLDDGPEHGIPLGGLGAGCIGRAPNGTFNLWHLDGGEHIFGDFSACQFAVYESMANESQTYAMATAGKGLNNWQWYPAENQNLSGSGGHSELKGGAYKALYPRSWYCYEDIFETKLVCEQFSPIWPNNYRESSYPVAVFVWTAHNPTEQPVTLSILLSWQNMVGWFTNSEASPDILQREDGSPFYDYVPSLKHSVGNFNRRVADETTTGIVMDGAWTGSPGEGDGQFCIAVSMTDAEVTYHTRWNPDGDGSELWTEFSKNGTLGNVADTTSATADEQIAGAIAVKFTLEPGETKEIPFCLSWDLPVTEFATGKQAYRRYTDFFGHKSTGSTGRHAWQLAQTALANYQTWQQTIINWQQPILDRSDLPDWFKMALFNELYDMASGGTLWSAATEADPVGQFGVLECLDYRWYESLDVRLYGGFSTLMLWPELEKAILRAFARAIPKEDLKKRIIGYYYTVGEAEHLAPRKLKGATPHDLGAPNEIPWIATNYTSYQDCNQWKDLPSDFVLQVYRAFLLTGRNDIEFLAECWPAVTETLQYLKLFDLDGDGVPENGGAPDQTFDDWQLKGLSAYCGGLWLAALEAAIKIGETLQQHQKISGSFAIVKSQYQRWIKQGKIVYQNKLWTGSFYRLDTESNSDTVMADQLCGQFFARLMELPDIVDEDCIETTLNTIYDACFVKFNEYAATHVKPQNQKFEGAQTGMFSAAQLGTAIGAANGVKPDGSPENPDDTHQLEVWTGINFGLAAFLAQMGQRDKAMAITEAVVKQIYDHGLQFRTPEAITAVGTFRACHYLRPMAIWGLYAQL